MATYPNQKTKDAEKTGDLNVASANFFGVPKDVREASKRQYKGGKEYTREDKIKIINYYKNKKCEA